MGFGFWLTGKLGHAGVRAWVVDVVLLWGGGAECNVLLPGLGGGLVGNERTLETM